MAVGTCAECKQEKELGSRTVCETCKKRLQRQKKADVPTPETIVPTEMSPVVHGPKALPGESREDWLARRVEETGSKGPTRILTGNPPGPRHIFVPVKWTLDDIDQAGEFGTLP